MKKVLTTLAGSAVLTATNVTFAFAQTDIDKGAADAGSPLGSVTLDGFFGKISSILIYLIGAVSVIMLIIGGFRYVISQGNAQAVTQAKDTILYSIVGIVVAILAFAIVKFVTKALT